MAKQLKVTIEIGVDWETGKRNDSYIRVEAPDSSKYSFVDFLDVYGNLTVNELIDVGFDPEKEDRHGFPLSPGSDCGNCRRITNDIYKQETITDGVQLTRLNEGNTCL